MIRSLLLALACAAVLHADDVVLGPDGKPLAGHSVHGGAFNEGPRQAAVLLPGTGKVHQEVTTKSPEAQKFYDQGVGQLHGFWYYEAERSFRQAAKLDPECAMAYCGLAMANVHNEKRAADFIKEAVKEQHHASDRERAWISAMQAFLGEGKDPTIEKRKALVKALEKIVFDYPDDIEARAYLVYQIWDNQQNRIPLESYTAVEALAQSVLAKNPDHPGMHHYLIHLWNFEDDRRALGSAAVLGQSAPGIAHMWHMPGHTFTKLQRFADAAWQQEASARTDHAYMAGARIMPEQIHNYAHNNDWLVEDLGYIGRVRSAIDLAKNMIELPRLAPKSIAIGKDGAPTERTGFSMGRRRLLDALLAWGHWEDLLALEGGPYLEASEDPQEDAGRLRILGIAAFESGNQKKGEEKIAALEQLIKTARENRFSTAENVERENKKAGKTISEIASALTQSFSSAGEKIDRLERQLAELRAYEALAAGKPMLEVKPLLEQAKDIPPVRLSRIYLKLGDSKKAVELAERAVKNAGGQVLPLANLADVQWRSGDKDAAKKTFETLRPLSAQADLGEMAFARLQPIASALGLPTDWRPKLEWPKDSGVRPDLDSLGPFRWRPYTAPSWEAVDQNGASHSLAEYKGKPLLLVFYLGSGCSHCVEQLNTIGPLAKDYEAAGINIVAVSMENPSDLQKTFVKAKDAQGFPFPIVADPGLVAFKAYRAFDDFENIPLHGTFLIDPAGYVRWQDISYRPMNDVKWLLTECKRLLALPVGPPPQLGAR